MARVVIVGGGVGGLEAYHLLKRRASVTVITNNSFYISGPSRPLILSNEQDLGRIVRGYTALGDDVVVARNVKVNLDERVVVADGRSFEYDYLIISTGMKPLENKFTNHRYFNVYDVGRLFDLKHILWTIKEGTVVVSAPRQPYRCAPAPAETALTIDMILRHRGVRKRVEIIYVDANKKIQPPVIHDVWKERFEAAGIEMYIGVGVSDVLVGAVELNDGEKIKADVPVILPENVGTSPLGEGFLEVRSPHDLRLVGYDDVFAVGDVAKLPFPKNSEIASISARIAAKQILEEDPAGEVYRFVGWAYAGNLEGELCTKSIKFELEFTQEGPKGAKDPQPKCEHTRAKDVWEQAVLRKLFGY